MRTGKNHLLAGLAAAVLTAANPVTVMAEVTPLEQAAGTESGPAQESSSPVIEVGIPANTGKDTGPGTGQGNVAPGQAGPSGSPLVEVAEKYSYESMVSDLEKLQSRYGSRLQVNVIGKSLDGRDLYEAVLGNPDAEKHILIHAGIHAREYMTSLLVMKQLEYGLEHYDQGSWGDQPFSTILHQVAVHFVPMVNPDGIALSQFGLDVVRSEELQREIQQCYENDIAQGRTAAALDRYLVYWKANARGVDLNQNFPANWERISPVQAPSFSNYKGTEPLSEPETQALAGLVSSRKWAATVSYHSMGNVIYWDYEGNRVRQESEELAALISACTGYRMAGRSGHRGFKDWTQIKEDPVPGVTIETGSVACPLPVSQFEDMWNRNKLVWILTARYAMEH